MMLSCGAVDILANGQRCARRYNLQGCVLMTPEFSSPRPVPVVRLADLPRLAEQLAGRVRGGGFEPNMIIYVETGARLPATSARRSWPRQRLSRRRPSIFSCSIATAGCRGPPTAMNASRPQSAPNNLSRSMRLALFDLDGTVLRGNSWHVFYWWTLRR